MCQNVFLMTVLIYGDLTNHDLVAGEPRLCSRGRFLARIIHDGLSRNDGVTREERDCVTGNS